MRTICKRWCSVLVSLAMLIALLPLAAVPAAAVTGLADNWSNHQAGAFSVSDGSAHTIAIQDGEELALLAGSVNDGNSYSGWTITLAADLDLGDYNWTPIGTYSKRYAGVFDGRGHSIAGLTVSGEYDDAGLFGFVESGGTVQNLAVSGVVDISVSNEAHAGGVVAVNLGTVRSCSFAGNVTLAVSGNKASSAGGVVGSNYGTVRFCAHSGSVAVSSTGSHAFAGGVVGKTSENVAYCQHSGDVTATGGKDNHTSDAFAGGVVGYISVTPCELSDCLCTGGTFSASGANANSAGAILGYYPNNAATVQNSCYLIGSDVLAVGSDVAFSSATVKGLTAAELVSPASYSGWDFDKIWSMTDAGPALRTGTAAAPRAASTWSELSDALQLCGCVTLGADVTWSENDPELVVPAGVSAVLDLNGKTVNRAANSGYSPVIMINSGALTLTDSGTGGRLTGGNNFTGGGVYVSDGAFTMDGGAITDNRGVQGGGVYVSDGVFTMNAGTISGNTADNDGGGVFVSGGAFTMDGGAISGNTATDGEGGGVHVFNGTFSVSGAPVVTGNCKGDGVDAAVNNVYLPSDKTVTVADALAEDADIGVTTETVPTAASPVLITSGWNTYMPDSAPADCFSADAFAIGLSGSGEAVLGVPVTVSITAGAGMERSDSTGAAVQTVVGGALMDPVYFAAQTGYYFPETADSTVSGVTVGYIGARELCVAGSPTADVYITLPDAAPLAAPEFSAAAGRVPAGTQVTLSCATEGAALRYTTDGSDPTVDSAAWSGPFTVTAPVTLKAVAVIGAASSAVTSASYTPTYAVTVTGGDGGGTYAAGEAVNITAGAAPAGQVFDKWTSADGVTFDNAAAATTGFTMPAKAVAVTANYKNTPAPVYYDSGPAPKPVVQTFDPVMTFEGGTVAVSPEKAHEGDEVLLSATSDVGNRLWSLTAERVDGKPLTMTSDALNSAKFTMPECQVEVYAVFQPVDAVMLPVALSPQRITVNGVEATVEAYNIGGTNFFRLRDLAALLRGTPAQFNVEYDALRNTVVMTTGQPYAGDVGTDFTDNSATAMPSPQTVEINGQVYELTAYNIGGFNFFGLRELSSILGYGVDYDAATNTAQLTSK